MTDLLYVLKASDQNEELRYSLRSVAANLPHDRVVIAGRLKPAWLSQDVLHIRTSEGLAQKWRNLVAAITQACEADELDEDLVYLNDDFFVMAPLDHMPILHRGPLPTGSSSNSYNAGHAATASTLRALGVDGELWNYEVHAPMPWRRSEMARALTLAAPVHQGATLHARTLYGNLLALEGTQIADVKVFGAGGDLQSPFLSTNDASFASQKVGKFIRAAFPEPCRYER